MYISNFASLIVPPLQVKYRVRNRPTKNRGSNRLVRVYQERSHCKPVHVIEENFCEAPISLIPFLFQLQPPVILISQAYSSPGSYSLVLSFYSFSICICQYTGSTAFPPTFHMFHVGLFTVRCARALEGKGRKPMYFLNGSRKNI